MVPSAMDICRLTLLLLLQLLALLLLPLPLPPPPTQGIFCGGPTGSAPQLARLLLLLAAVLFILSAVAPKSVAALAVLLLCSKRKIKCD